MAKERTTTMPRQRRVAGLNRVKFIIHTRSLQHWQQQWDGGLETNTTACIARPGALQRLRSIRTQSSILSRALQAPKPSQRGKERARTGAVGGSGDTAKLSSRKQELIQEFAEGHKTEEQVLELASVPSPDKQYRASAVLVEGIQDPWLLPHHRRLHPVFEDLVPFGEVSRALVAIQQHVARNPEGVYVSTAHSSKDMPSW